MRVLLHRLLTLALLLIVSPQLLCADTFTITDNSKNVDLIEHIAVLEDKTGQLTIDDVVKADTAFLIPTKGEWDKGFTRSAFWMRAHLKNISPVSDWYFMQWGSLSRHTEVYVATVEHGMPTMPVRLESLPHARLIQYHLSLLPNIEYVLYFRTQDIQAPLVISAMLVAANNMVPWVMDTYPSLSFVVGGLFILSVYNFLYFLSLRDRSFLALSVFILSFTLEMGGHSGLWQSVTWMKQWLNSIGSLFGALCLVSGVSLFRDWLDTQSNHPRLDRIWQWVFWLSVGFTILCPFIPFGVALLGLAVVVLLPLGLMSVACSYRKGFRLPWGISIAAVVFLISVSPAILRALGLIPEMDDLAQLSILGLLVALALVSLAQAEEFRKKKKQVERAEAANKVKDEFLTTMSHEMRTPMTAVVSAGHLLTLTRLSSLQSEYVSRLNTSSQHMLSLINDILDLARLDSQLLDVEQTPFILDDILQQLEQLLVEQARDRQVKLVMENHFHSLHAQLLGDPLRLQQILLNLLSNAIKFTWQAPVCLRVTPKQRDGEQIQLLFEVIDSGIGMSAEEQAQLFQPFSQASSGTARQYGGTGLGLAISDQLVRCMNGELKLESQLGQGSRFFFSLSFPCCPIHKDHQAMLSQSLSNITLQGLHILLVDDNEMNRFFGSELLSSLGLEVATVASGQQALAYVSAHMVDLIFMDIEMPEMDGYMTTQQLRIALQGQELPIIALTANAIAGERARCLDAGMTDYLAKPFVREELRDIVYRYTTIS